MAPVREEEVEAGSFLARFALEIVRVGDQLDEIQAFLPNGLETGRGLDPRVQLLDDLTQRTRALAQVANLLAAHGAGWKLPVAQLTRDITLSELAARLSGATTEERSASGDLELL